MYFTVWRIIGVNRLSEHHALSLRNLDKDLYQEIINKRRDLMIDAPLYTQIKSEGRVEGRVEGLAEGLRWTLVDNLEAMGAPLGSDLVARINAQTDVPTLRKWTRLMRSCQTVAEFEAKLDQ